MIREGKWKMNGRKENGKYVKRMERKMNVKEMTNIERKWKINDEMKMNGKQEKINGK